VNSKIIIFILSVLTLGGIFIYFYRPYSDTTNQAVVCTMDAKLCPDGSYVGRTGPKCEFSECPSNSKKDLIVVDTPIENTLVSSPLIIKGRARGNWFFEASFPVFLTDWDGRIIAQGIAEAKEDWMTENFVPFEATLEFTKPPHINGVKNIGALILKKDNPSGLPQHDDAIEMTVNFE